MAPRLPQKRRAGDEDSPARNNKRGGKNKREVTYDTYEEAMDGGVDYEEKGERYRDGDRAQRNYERSLELYQQAYGMQEEYDSAYNQARVLYTLATAFLLPPTAVDYLTKSIELYRKASSLTESPLLQLDAGFNLAQSCTTLADMREELDERDPQVRASRDEARTVLEQVFQGQEEYLSQQAEQQDEEATEAAVDEGADTSGDTPAPASDGMEVEGGEDEATYELHLPTPSSIMDTMFALVDTHLSIWVSVDPIQPPDEAQQTAVRSILDRAARWCPPGRQAELDLAEMKVLLAMDGIIWDLFKAHATPGSGSLQSLEGASAALSRLLDSLDQQTPDEPTVRAEIIMTLAECHIKVANRSIVLSTQLPPGPNPLAQQAWFHHSQAITFLTKALELPITADTPREFRPSVLLELSKGSLARARLAPVNETAKSNLLQLVTNATTYAGRAAEGLGLPWVKIDSGAAAKAEIPAPRGWDMEVLGRETILQQIRVCLFASEMELAMANKGKLNEGMARLFGLLKQVESRRRIQKRDVERWVGDLEDEEVVISDTERGWWEKVVAELGV
ncbi:uncharacterized protein MKK02DRAFT_25382 [Dioszegia hungarica]|uniref:Uncharacterized protein n=1 Tax=Dioszegia hungarica TaxID=4972 RepID=A0AA38LSY7_9TREE|nr:uncharacterized protein MKK02DRAFT_25382 [Dioszegia hungarica]KAI9636342.1 hypothetical protein MKK02DRAFT_25382 [Dioszegia hungarica]